MAFFGGQVTQTTVTSSTLPSGAATAANQSTIIGHVDGIEGLLTTIDTDTSSLAGCVSGSELQVDVLTMPSVTVDSEFPAAVTITDNFANPDTTSVMAMAMLWDGAAWDRAPGDSTDGISVNLGTNNDVTMATLPDTAAGDLAALVAKDFATQTTLATLALESGGNLDTIAGDTTSMDALLTTIDTDTSALAGTVSGSELQVDVVAELPAGTQTIGSVKLTDGTDTADVETLSSSTHDIDDKVGVVTAANIYGRIDDDTVAPLKSDASTASLMIIDYAHHEIHSGSHYFVSGTVDVVGAATNQDILVVTPNSTKWAHMLWTLEAEDEFVFYLYEDTTTSADGSAATEINNNRNSANTADVVVTTGPTVTGVGTLIDSATIGAAKTIGSDSRDKELILKSNTKYLFRFTKTNAGTHWLNYKLSWYEHTNKF
jgi:hypothetical protein